MISQIKKTNIKVWGMVAMLTLFSASTLKAAPLTQTELHATMGIVTNFILDDGITHNGTSYGTVTSPYTGRVWLDRNLGASRVCTSLADTVCFGDYYQWGRNADGHQKSTSVDIPTLANNVTNVGHGDFITTTTLPKDWASVDTAGATRSTNWSKTDGTSVCPVGFRIPSLVELQAELLDVGSAEITNNTDAFNSFLVFPSVGYRHYGNGIVSEVGTSGSVWSGLDASYIYFFDGGTFASSNTYRAYGFAVRCIEKVKPKEHYHNGTAYGEVISPYTGKVWLDRNLGAKRVCTSFNDTACYGDYYQWGRNFDGHEDSMSTTTNTQAIDVNAAGSSFIIGSGDWALVDGAGTTRTAKWSVIDGTSVCPVGFRVPTIVELSAELLDAGSAQIANNTDAFNSFLVLPSPGYRDYGSASLLLQGSWGYVWSSSFSGLSAQSVGFTSGGKISNGYFPAFGFSVRCLKD